MGSLLYTHGFIVVLLDEPGARVAKDRSGKVIPSMPEGLLSPLSRSD